MMLFKNNNNNASGCYIKLYLTKNKGDKSISTLFNMIIQIIM